MQPIVCHVYGSVKVLKFYWAVLLVVIACDSPHIGNCAPDSILLIKKKWIQILFKQINSPASLSPAILVYRVFRNEAKRNTKLLHGIIHLLALIISIVGKRETERFSCVKECLHKCIKNKNDPPPPSIGFVAVFDFHREAKIPDMYSLHSWLGMATLLLFCIQVHTHTRAHTHYSSV